MRAVLLYAAFVVMRIKEQLPNTHFQSTDMDKVLTRTENYPTEKNGENDDVLSVHELDALMIELCLEGGGKAFGDHISKIGEAIRYHYASGGSRVRARLAYDLSSRLSLPLHDKLAIAACCELIHNASLIHDDIQDKDNLRRGIPALWVRYGKDQAVCIGDLMLSAAYMALTKITSHPENIMSLVAAVHKATASLIGGQCMDLAYTAQTDYSLSDYERAVEGKAGALLTLPHQLPFLLTGQKHSLEIARKATLSFGTGYQMIDDIDDFHLDMARSENRFNAVSIAMACENLSDKQALVAVIHRAHQHLNDAEDYAAMLPDRTGDPLSSFIRIYRQKLK